MNQKYFLTLQQTKRAVELSSPRSRWDFDPSSIFAQIDAFVQRCRDLLEVCEAQVLFARKSAKLPKGQVGPTTMSAIQIECFCSHFSHLETSFLICCSRLFFFQRAPLPVFGGCRGPDIEKSLYEIEDAFEKYIDRLRRLDYDIMDVKATKWHDDYNFFTNGVKDLEGTSLFLTGFSSYAGLNHTKSRLNYSFS